MNKYGTLLIYLFLCAAFLAFSLGIYLNPDAQAVGTDPNLAGRGKLVYQKYNCQSCHQLYNLGGYLGPDLTNCYSAPGKGELFIRAMLVTGTKQMPVFKIPEDEIVALLAFFRQLDKTGSSNLRHFVTKPDGTITKHE